MGKAEKIFIVVISFVCLFMIIRPVESYDKELDGQRRIIKSETEDFHYGDQVTLSGNTMECITFESDLLETKDGSWVFESDLM